MLLLRKESFFRFNRLMLVGIMILSLVLPLCNFHFLSMGVNPINQNMQGVIEIGMPYAEVLSENGAKAHEGLTINWWSVLSYLYIIGLVITILWKLFQVLLLYRQIHKGVLWTEKQGDVTIYCHANDIAPFSWFKTIVISEEDFTHNATEILRHEMGHIQSLHSLDILLVNVIESLQWCNPLAWILAGSLRDVHEYEADDAVLHSGVNAHQYQSLLIKKAVGSSSYAFANSFNHSLLKKRITMMLQKKSNPWMRGKALYILPVAVIALSAFATPEVNQQVESVVNDVAETNGKVTKVSEMPQVLELENNQSSVNNTISKTDAKSDTISNSATQPLTITKLKGEFNSKEDPLIYIDGKEGDLETLLYETLLKHAEDIKSIGVFPRNSETTKELFGERGNKYGVFEVKTNKSNETDDAYEAADKMPEYPGGIPELIKYVGSELRYPEKAQKLGVTGRVILGFVVEKDGSVSEVEVESCTNNVPVSKDDERSSEVLVKQKVETNMLFQDEAIRVVKSMPKWTPGEKDGKKVRVRYHLPITFNLQ